MRLSWGKVGFALGLTAFLTIGVFASARAMGGSLWPVVGLAAATFAIIVVALATGKE